MQAALDLGSDNFFFRRTGSSLCLNFKLTSGFVAASHPGPFVIHQNSKRQTQKWTELDFVFWFVSLFGNQGILWMSWYEEAGEQEICKAAAN